MKIGDVVMFVDRNTPYARWFYGKIGTVVGHDAPGEYCCIEWIAPVYYWNSYTASSSFSASYIKVLKSAA